MPVYQIFQSVRRYIHGVQELIRQRYLLRTHVRIGIADIKRMTVPVEHIKKPLHRIFDLRMNFRIVCQPFCTFEHALGKNDLYVGNPARNSENIFYIVIILRELLPEETVKIDLMKHALYVRHTNLK